MWKRGRARSGQGLSEDLGGDAGGRREADQARRQRRADPARLRFRLAVRAAYWFTLNTMMHQLGANLIDETTTRRPSTRRQARKVFHYWSGLGEQVSTRRAAIHRQPAPTFSAAKLATDCSFGIWGIPQMHDAKIDWTVMPLPRFAGGGLGQRHRRLCLLHDGQCALVAGGAEGGMEAGADFTPTTRRSCSPAPDCSCRARR